MLTHSKPVIATLFACALGAAACAGQEGGQRSKSPRAQWVDNPTTGTTDQGKIVFSDLAVSFEVPDTLYVYRSCAEADHSPAGPDGKWVPIIQCSAGNPSAGGGESESEGFDEFGSDDELDEFDREDQGVLPPFTIYAAHKDMVINERTVETMRTRFEREGWIVDEIGYHSAYQDKPNRTGIELRVHTPSSQGEAGNETWRFMFPTGDVLFIAEVNYPGGTDRSGINQDWARLLWNFQLDEDGPLYPEG